MRLKSATLEQIAKANGKLTGDELRAQRKAQEEADIRAMKDAEPRYMTSRQRRALKKCIERGNSA